MLRLHDNRHRRWVIQWALSLLVLVQFLGLLHGVVHRPPQAAGVAAPAALAGIDAPRDASLFGHERDSLDCRLFDHLAHADLAPGDVPALPGDTGATPHVAHAPHGLAPRFERPYSARAPPAAA